MTRLIHLDSASAETFGITDRSEYGIDGEAPFPEIDTLNNVEIPDSRVSLCDFYMEELSSTVFHTCSRWQRRHWLHIDAVIIIKNAIKSVSYNAT